jgi:hypothetical protein
MVSGEWWALEQLGDRLGDVGGEPNSCDHVDQQLDVDVGLGKALGLEFVAVTPQTDWLVLDGPTEHCGGAGRHLFVGEGHGSGQRVRLTLVTCGVGEHQCGDLGDVSSIDEAGAAPSGGQP